jgi:hypothetical protein
VRIVKWEKHPIGWGLTLGVLLGFLVGCAGLAGFFAPTDDSMIITKPGAAATDTSPAIPTQTVVVRGQGGGDLIKDVGGFLPPPFGSILSILGGVAATAGGIYMKSQNSKLSKSQKIVEAVIQGVEAAGDTAKEVKKLIQANVRTAGSDVSAELEKQVADLTHK